MYEKYQPAYHQPAYNDGGVNFPGNLEHENLVLIFAFQNFYRHEYHVTYNIVYIFLLRCEMRV